MDGCQAIVPPCSARQHFGIALSLVQQRRRAYLPFGTGATPGGDGTLAPPGLLAGATPGAMPIVVGALTVTAVCPLMLPMLAVTSALPGLVPVTFPLVSTLATCGASLLHTT
jgi:hypothetical protein